MPSLLLIGSMLNDIVDSGGCPGGARTGEFPSVGTADGESLRSDCAGGLRHRKRLFDLSG